MQPFQFMRADNLEAVARLNAADTEYLAGGTTLLDLMKLEVMRPARIVDINALEQAGLGTIESDTDGLRLGAMVRMAQAADHPDIRKNFPMISQSLDLAASPQIRNMASLGGNVLQRTRCPYFRDLSYNQCNKRNPGSGCAALEGVNRMHAVLGTSPQCIATYAGDFGQALIALDALVEVNGAQGNRVMPFATLHKLPADAPQTETTLAPGDLIVAFHIPTTAMARRSSFLKIRDRQSYEFALASAAVALDITDGLVRQARIALGGVATVPWRAGDAERVLAGKPLRGDAFEEATLTAVTDAAFAGAEPRAHNAFKIELGKRTLARALQSTAAMEV